ncbi:MAG: hypothetical protein ACM3H8_06785, partial [Sphingobacteriales bacterium]
MVSLKKRLPLHLILLFLVFNSHSQTSGCIENSNKFLLGLPSARISVTDQTMLKDSSIIIGGIFYSSNQTDTTFFISKLDKTNNILFSKKINGNRIFLQDVIESSNGDLILGVRLQNDFSNHSYYLYRLTFDGNIIWQKYFYTTIVSPDLYDNYTRMTIHEDKDGNIYLATSFTYNDISTVPASYYYINKIDQTGSSIWKTSLTRLETSNSYIAGM